MSKQSKRPKESKSFKRQDLVQLKPPQTEAVFKLALAKSNLRKQIKNAADKTVLEKIRFRIRKLI